MEGIANNSDWLNGRLSSKGHELWGMFTPMMEPADAPSKGAHSFKSDESWIAPHFV
jgi:hypothetical protein